MRIESIHLLMFASSILLAAVLVGVPTISGEHAALVIVGHAVMFLLLGVRTNGQVHHDKAFDPER